MTDRLVFTAHEDCCLAIADTLTGFVAEGCAVLVLPWRKGLYRCGISLPAGSRADLASDIAAQGLVLILCTLCSHAA